MASIDLHYLDICAQIIQLGKEYGNKNRGVKRLQIPSATFRHPLDEGFPAITVKKVNWRHVVGELIWMLRGDTDIAFLSKNGIKIWNQDAYNWHVKNGGKLTFDEFEALGAGSVGRNYGAQWRNYNGAHDQITALINGMRSDIMSSRLKVNAWNPAELDQTALPPCHSEFQVVGVPLGEDKFGFELHWNQRSVDVFLGLPNNIAFYGLLALLLERITGYKALAIQPTLKCVHLYDNQYDAANTLLSRDPYAHPNCTLNISKNIEAGQAFDTMIQGASIGDFTLEGYTSHPAVVVKMLAPIVNGRV